MDARNFGLYFDIVKLVLSIFIFCVLVFVFFKVREDGKKIEGLERDLIKLESARDVCQKNVDLLGKMVKNNENH